MDFHENQKQRLFDMLAQNSADKLHDTFSKMQRLMAYYRCAMMEVETKFRVLNEEFSLHHERNPIDSVKTRLKSFDSIAGKLTRKGLPVTLDSIEQNLNDVAGVRVICAFQDDIYKLAECLEAQDDITILERKDYIQAPKDNGYRSLHLIVQIPIFLEKEKRSMRVEVQLRTIAMELWANLEHRIRYKKDVSDSLLAKTAPELLECASLCALLDEKMQTARKTIDSEA